MPEAFEELILGLTRQPGEGWGLNINNASFKVTKVAPEGAASKSRDPPKTVGDHQRCWHRGALAGACMTLLDNNTRASEMRDAFVQAGDVCQLRIKRPIPNEEELDSLPGCQPSKSKGMLSRWGRPSEGGRRPSTRDCELSARR